MGILDEAIREHLELKRQHGAGDSELKQLEDEAFGPPGRPGDEETIHDPFAEAPTEFMATPDLEEEPPAVADEPSAERQGEARSRRESPGIADLQEAPSAAASSEDEAVADEYGEAEGQATEHEVLPESPPPGIGPTTEERHAIAEQPTELFDVEEDVAAAESTAPSDEELAEDGIAEPRPAPVDPIVGMEEVEAATAGATEEEEDDEEFFNEQRLSEELDQALEAPLEHDVEAERPSDEDEDESEDEDENEDEEESEDIEEEGRAGREDDVLEDTPDFLEDSDDDQLWFEQKPPKDFDFDD
jgi:hypothetical protein